MRPRTSERRPGGENLGPRTTRRQPGGLRGFPRPPRRRGHSLTELLVAVTLFGALLAWLPAPRPTRPEPDQRPLLRAVEQLLLDARRAAAVDAPAVLGGQASRRVGRLVLSLPPGRVEHQFAEGRWTRRRWDPGRGWHRHHQVEAQAVIFQVRRRAHGDVVRVRAVDGDLLAFSAAAVGACRPAGAGR